MIANLTTAAPVEIDTKLAELYNAAQTLGAEHFRHAEAMHRAVGDRSRHLTRSSKAWSMTLEEAIEAARAIADPNAPTTYRMGPDPHAAHNALTGLLAAREALAANRAEAEPLHAEYRRRPWSRFFTVQAGHIHGSDVCQTLHRNGKATPLGWNPVLSGKSEAEAMAHFGQRAHVLCTVCFPNAPLEWTEKPADDSKCAGGQAVGAPRRVGRNSYGQCPTCETHGHIITASGDVRKHNKPKS